MSTDLAVRFRPALLGLAALRAVLGVVAVPLAPVLYGDHVALLVLLRPSKEVLLLAGFAARDEGENLAVIVAAAVPLMVFAVWLFYALGRSYRRELDDADLPGIAGRLLPPTRVRHLRDALNDRKWSLVFLGRLAMLPSTLVAAAAGSAGLDVRTFLLADTIGALASMVMIIGAGWALGAAYEDAGPWLTGIGALALLGVLVVFGRHLTRSRR
jgi:membrane protein DedA with SNARE-associated domain